jgi:hypothetical protein
MQCCGDEFELGQTVEWTVSPHVDREYLATVIGEDAAAAVTDYEDHHDVAEGEVGPVRGTVTAIKAVSCEFAPQGRALYPVPGTAVIGDRRQADGWEREGESRKFLGYLVSLSPAGG